MFGFDHTFYGNTITQWATAGLLVLLSFALARTVFWLFTKLIAPLTKRTRTDFDDILVEKAKQPAGLAIALVGSRLALETLVLSGQLKALMTGVFNLFIALNIAWLLTRSYDAVHIRYLLPLAAKSKTSLDDQLMPVVQKGVRGVVWVLAAVVGLNNAGYDVMAVVGGMGIGGLAFALAAKDAVANVFGGVTIMTTQPFKLGHCVRVGDVVGWVRQVGLRNSILVDIRGWRYSIPNKLFTDSAVANLDQREWYWRELRLRLSQSASAEDVRRVFDVCKDIVSDSPLHSERACHTRLEHVGREGFVVLFRYGTAPVEPGPQTVLRELAGRTHVNLEMVKRLSEAGIRLAVPIEAHTAEPQGRGLYGL